MRTYLTGKIGKSVKFNPSTWSAIGGDNEFPTLIRKMAELNPNDTFIIIGRNDIEKNRRALNLPDNLIDVYEGASKEERSDVNYIIEKLKDVQIDGCFLGSGPTANCNIPNKSYKRTELKNGNKIFAKSLATFQNYVAPLYNYLNETNIPWVMIANDPRYILQGNDLMNQPKKVLSQYDETVLMQTFDNWEDQNYVKNPIECQYAGMEKIFLIDKKLPENMNKTTTFMMVLNEGNNGVKSRYPMLKEYVLDNMQDVKIYGKWTEETIGEDTRFKGPKKFEDLQEELPHVKYTLIIPIKPGWVTAKWVEMIANGIIPFFHPTYDEQNHCPVPDYIRLKNPNELGTKIQELENDSVLYNNILKECLNCITKQDLTGEKISEIILSETPSINKPGKTLEREIKEIELDEW